MLLFKSKDTKMKTRTESILTVMHVLAWIAFVGLMIEAGAKISYYGVSLLNQETTKKLYMGLDLYDLMKFSFGYYTLTAAFLIAISCLKAHIAYQVVKLLSKINLANPFTPEVATLMENISYTTFATWLVAMVYNGLAEGILRIAGNNQTQQISGEFIFMAGVVFVISQIFRRGIEIQTENELTV